MTKWTLEQVKEKAREHVSTPAERRAQRVSLVLGLQSKGSTLSREEVESLLGEIEGHEPVHKKEVA